MKLSPLLFRRIHKWVGLVIGLQFVIWTISGALMAVLDMETVAGGSPPPAAKTAPLPFATAAWPAVQRSLGAETGDGTDGAAVAQGACHRSRHAGRDPAV